MALEQTIQHPGIYINAIIAVGMAIWVLVSGLIVYIWRSNLKVTKEKLDSSEKRIAELEVAKALALDKLVLNPVLTIPVHEIFCNGVWTRFNERVMLMEDNIGLKIKNAILEAARNGAK
jgi:hypothetical protein